MDVRRDSRRWIYPGQEELELLLDDLFVLFIYRFTAYIRYSRVSIVTAVEGPRKTFQKNARSEYFILSETLVQYYIDRIQSVIKIVFIRTTKKLG